MKHYIIALLALACACFGKVEIEFNKLSSHNGDIWTIRTVGAINKYKVPHAYVKSNALTIKWNIKKGRLSVKCGGLCNEDDEYLIRMFDKDSLRIDFVAYDIKPDKYASGDEYIIPSDVRKEIAYMEIIPLNDDWKPEYEVMCQDGYTIDNNPSHHPPLSMSDIPSDEMFQQMVPLLSTCMKQAVPKDDYVPDGGWYSDTHEVPKDDSVPDSGWYSDTHEVPKDDSVSYGGWYSDTRVGSHDCPPSWQDNDGRCKSGWYSN